MNLRFHVVRDYFRDLCYCPTALNRADPLTKPLCGEKYINMFLAAAESDSDECEMDLECEMLCEDEFSDDQCGLYSARSYYVSF